MPVFGQAAGRDDHDVCGSSASTSSASASWLKRMRDAMLLALRDTPVGDADQLGAAA